MTPPIYTDYTETPFQNSLSGNNFLSYSLGPSTFGFSSPCHLCSSPLPPGAHTCSSLEASFSTCHNQRETELELPPLTMTHSHLLRLSIRPYHNNSNAKHLPAYLNPTRTSVTFKSFFLPLHIKIVLYSKNVYIYSQGFSLCVTSYHQEAQQDLLSRQQLLSRADICPVCIHTL